MNITELPYEVLNIITRDLYLNDIFRLGSINKLFYNHLNSGLLLYNFIKKINNNCIININNEYQSYPAHNLTIEYRENSHINIKKIKKILNLCRKRFICCECFKPISNVNRGWYMSLCKCIDNCFPRDKKHHFYYHLNCISISTQQNYILFHTCPLCGILSIIIKIYLWSF